MENGRVRLVSMIALEEGGYMVPRLCNFSMPALLPLLDDWPDVEAWLSPRLCCCFGG